MNAKMRVKLIGVTINLQSEDEWDSGFTNERTATGVIQSMDPYRKKCKVAVCSFLFIRMPGLTNVRYRSCRHELPPKEFI